MIVEYIRYQIDPTRAKEFEDAYRRAGALLDASPHCRRWEAARCVDEPEKQIVRIEWDSPEGHLEGFRKSPDFKPFLEATEPFFKDIEEMTHYQVTAHRTGRLGDTSGDGDAGPITNGGTESSAREEFDARVHHILQTTCEVSRALIGAHQAAMAMLVGGDWTQARKYFSLSDKYEQWKDFTMPARGIGLHALVVAGNESLRLTQAEVEQHSAWRAYADSAGKHQPLRGLLAVPIVGEDGLNYGLLQVSDKADGGDFDADDERHLRGLAEVAAVGLDALRKVLALRLGEPAPATRLQPAARFVVIEPA